MKYITIFFLTFVSQLIYSQGSIENLVINGDFKDFKKISYNKDEAIVIDSMLISKSSRDSDNYLFFIKNWHIPDYSSPDFYDDSENYCNDNSCIGIITSYNGNDYREFIEGRLKEKLIKDSLYLISFNIRPFYRIYKEKGSVIPPEMGVLFSDTLIPNGGINFKDTKTKSLYFKLPTKGCKFGNWCRIEELYKAKGGELFITIGNFMKDKHFIKKKVRNRIGYLLIDDVSVKPALIIEKENTTHFMQNK